MSGDAGHQSGQMLVDAIRELRIELVIANDRVAEAAGLNPRDLDVLDVIDCEAPITPGQLSTRTGLRAATLTGVLARLEKQGWIERTPSPRDARVALLTSTDRFDELRSLYVPGDTVAKGVGVSLDAEQLALVVSVLRQVSDAARAGAGTLAHERGRGSARVGGLPAVDRQA